MDIPNITLGEMVADDYRTAKIFQKYDIDYSSQGEQILRKTLENKNIHFENFLEEIKKSKSETQLEPNDFNKWSLDVLADYIVNTHHQYSEEQSLKIKADLDELCTNESGSHPELLEIQAIFKTASGEMASHMKKEELILFPFIKRVLKAKESNMKIEAPPSRMENPIDMMIHDHSDQLEGFKKIRALAKNYNPPAEVSTNYVRTFKLLQLLEQDLFKHIHLENNILFPKAVVLGRKWTTG